GEHHPQDVGPERQWRCRGHPRPRHGVAPIRAGPTGSVVTSSDPSARESPRASGTPVTPVIRAPRAAAPRMAYRSRVRIGLLTREYPPDVYGGAGVHVEHLAPALRELVDVDVHCFGEPRAAPDTYAHQPPTSLDEAN